MMTKHFTLLAITMFCFTALAQDATQQDLQKLQGEWLLISRSSSETSKVMQTIKGTEYEFEVTDQNGRTGTGKVIIKLDATKEPKIFDRTGSNGEMSLGIYKLEGDTLTICTASLNSKVRPSEFSAIEDAGDGVQSVTTWKRAGSDPPQPKK